MDLRKLDHLDPDGVYSMTKTGDQWRELVAELSRSVAVTVCDLVRRMATAGGYTESQRAAILDVANQFETGVTGWR